MAARVIALAGFFVDCGLECEEDARAASLERSA